MASRVAFIWAFTVPHEPDGGRSAPIGQYVEACFLADGEYMSAAGSMAAGINAPLMSLKRRSSQAAWHVDGLCYPWGVVKGTPNKCINLSPRSAAGVGSDRSRRRLCTRR